MSEIVEDIVDVVQDGVEDLEAVAEYFRPASAEFLRISPVRKTSRAFKKIGTPRSSGATTKGVREWKNVALNNPLFDEGLILRGGETGATVQPIAFVESRPLTSRPLLFAHNAKSQSRGERVPFGRVRVCRPVDDDPTRHVDIAEEC